MSLEMLVEKYQPGQETIEIVRATPLVFLVGIAGAGKNTLANELLRGDDFKLIVSHTTRQPRANNGVDEIDGVDYHFITSDQAKTMLEMKEFVEAKYVHGTIYGTSAAAIQSIHTAQKIGLADIDVQGVDEYMALSKKITPIFILPPDYSTWQERFLRRYDGVVDEADLLKRKQSAIKELRHALDVDYYHFVINDDVARATKVIRGIASGESSLRANNQARQIAAELLASFEL